MICFADNVKSCAALKDKQCHREYSKIEKRFNYYDCVFFKSLEQKIIDDERTEKRLESIKSKAINILS